MGIKVGKINWCQMHLDEIKDSIHLDQFSKISEPIQEAIKKSTSRIDELQQYNNAEEAVEDEAHYIEDLLGVMFVISQSYVEHIVTKVKHLDREMKKLGNYQFNFSINRGNLLQLSPDIAIPANKTMLEVIEAAANLFKHGPQWTNWTTSNPNIDTLLAIGCTQGSTGNFRKMASVCKNPQYDNLALETFLASWSFTLHSKAESYLKTNGLIT